MANFVKVPGEDGISGQTIHVPNNQVYKLGLWGFQEGAGGPALILMTSPVVQWNSVGDRGRVRTFALWGMEPGETKVEAVASNRSVWDWVKLSVAQPAKKRPARAGVIPADVLDAVIAAHRKWGICISVALAQWAVESDWGASMPSNSNNPLGIKSGRGQQSSQADTEEEVDGKRVKISAGFRAFGSLRQAFDAYGRLLATDPHYVRSRTLFGQPNALADSLTKVYATASNYGMVLKGRMKAYNLYQYDQAGRSEPYIFPDEMRVPRD